MGWAEVWTGLEGVIIWAGDLVGPGWIVLGLSEFGLSGWVLDRVRDAGLGRGGLGRLVWLDLGLSVLLNNSGLV